MSQIETRRLSVAFNNVVVLNELDLKINDGEFLVLLGPSGCGKSTLLNAIAGLLDVSGGQVWIGGRNVTWAEPKDRGIAMVFQSYALYPAMDVYGNLAFSLRVAGMKKQEIDARVTRAAEMLELVPLLRRRPSALSGGQRQRVAIGQSLVREVGRCVPVRRAIVEPRCATARRVAGGDQATASAARQHHGLCHP
jgi:multiple sugar transport system ATP-binding protein